MTMRCPILAIPVAIQTIYKQKKDTELDYFKALIL